jgi:hypothetical protein
LLIVAIAERDDEAAAPTRVADPSTGTQFLAITGILAITGNCLSLRIPHVRAAGSLFG